MKKINKKDIGRFIDYFNTEVIKDNVPPPFNDCKSNATCKLCGYQFIYNTCGGFSGFRFNKSNDWNYEEMAEKHILAAHFYRDKIT